MDKKKENLIPDNSFEKNFLQSEQWRKFQESVGRKTFHLENDNFRANIILHTLPLVGRYFYLPRGPIMSCIMKHEAFSKQIQELIKLAKENKAGWIRIEPENEKILNLIKKNIKYKTIKAPHDMQPKETFVIDIAKSEEEILAGMKSKTRYNIKLAEKKEVRIKKREVSGEYVEDFLRLSKIMAERQGIVIHDESYYRKMFEVIPNAILKLYVAEYKGVIIVANIVIFYGDTCIYLHGASDDKYKNLMAPYLLQWQAIKDAKAVGYAKYDFGGGKIRSKNKEARSKKNSWEGITRFKLGFSPNTETVEYPGCYDIIINQKKYWLYRTIQKIKSFL